MDQESARRIVEAFRRGTPPDIHIRDFTRGKRSEIRELTRKLQTGDPGAVLLQAQDGCGKTHLLRLLQETALNNNFAVSFVSLDSSAEVRFNRMDQVFGAVFRGISLPGSDGRPGGATFMEFLSRKIRNAKPGSSKGFWSRLTNNGSWNTTDTLESPSVFVGLRAWCVGDKEAKNLVENWLGFPWNYYDNRTLLYDQLVGNLKSRFTDPRPRSVFFNVKEPILNFQELGYSQSWAALRDLRLLVREAGLKDMVLLFDEVEDIIDGLGNPKFQKIALRNLLRFFSGTDFTGISFFAVTPTFGKKCHDLLAKTGSWSNEFTDLRNLAHVAMSPLGQEDLRKLAAHILVAHGRAYDWEDEVNRVAKAVGEIVDEMFSAGVEDRVRRTISAVVGRLDHVYSEKQDERHPLT